MFKFVSFGYFASNSNLIFRFQASVVFFAVIAFAAAKPSPQVVVAPAVDVVSPYVVSTSSQYVARNFNGFAGAYVAESPVVASAYVASPYAYSPYTYPYVF